MSGQLLVKLLLHWATSSLMPLFSQLLLLSGLLLLWTASAPSYFPLSATSYFRSFCNPSSVRAASAVPFATSSQTWHYAQKSLDESEPNVIRIISLGPTWLVKNVGAYKNIWKKKLPWPWYKKRCLWNLLAIGLLYKVAPTALLIFDVTIVYWKPTQERHFVESDWLSWSLPNPCPIFRMCML